MTYHVTLPGFWLLAAERKVVCFSFHPLLKSGKIIIVARLSQAARAAGIATRNTSRSENRVSNQLSRGVRNTLHASISLNDSCTPFILHCPVEISATLVVHLFGHFGSIVEPTTVIFDLP